MINKIRKWIGIGICSLATTFSTQANDFGIGTRGPEWSNLQLDLRFGASEKITTTTSGESKTEGLTQTTFLKYWNTLHKGTSGNIGLYGQAILPYSQLINGEARSEGVGDLKLGIGPRFSYGNNASIHCLTYIGPVLPTGKEDIKPALGTGRKDWNTGMTATFFPEKSKRKEVTLSLDYIKAENIQENPSDTLTFGALEGMFISQNIQIGLRELYTRKLDGNQSNANSTSLGAAIRYMDPKRRFQIELIGDKTISTDNLPEGWNASLIFRYNFNTSGEKR